MQGIESYAKYVHEIVEGDWYYADNESANNEDDYGPRSRSEFSILNAMQLFSAINIATALLRIGLKSLFNLAEKIHSSPIFLLYVVMGALLSPILILGHALSEKYNDLIKYIVLDRDEDDVHRPAWKRIAAGLAAIILAVAAPLLVVFAPYVAPLLAVAAHIFHVGLIPFVAVLPGFLLTAGSIFGGCCNKVVACVKNIRPAIQNINIKNALWKCEKRLTPLDLKQERVREGFKDNRKGWKVFQQANPDFQKDSPETRERRDTYDSANWEADTCLEAESRTSLYSSQTPFRKRISSSEIHMGTPSFLSCEG